MSGCNCCPLVLPPFLPCDLQYFSLVPSSYSHCMSPHEGLYFPGFLVEQKSKASILQIPLILVFDR